MYPFEKFTDEAKGTLTQAQGEAERSGVGFIGTEHVLLGLLCVTDGLAARALAEFDWDIVVARQAIERVAKRSPWRPKIEHIHPTGRVKRVVELSFEEARRVGSPQVTTGSLLVGLLLEHDGIASHVLGEGGISVEKVRASLDALTRAGVNESMDSAKSEVDQPTSVQPIMTAADHEAARMGVNLETDHIWRALLRHDAFTLRVLTKLGVDPGDVLAVVTPPEDVGALVDELEKVRSEEERAIAERRRSDALAAHERATGLLQAVNERLRRWRDTLE